MGTRMIATAINMKNEMKNNMTVSYPFCCALNHL